MKFPTTGFNRKGFSVLISATGDEDIHYRVHIQWANNFLGRVRRKIGIATVMSWLTEVH